MHRSLSSVAKQFIIMLLFDMPLVKKAFEHMNPSAKNFYTTESEVVKLRVFVEDIQQKDKVKVDPDFSKVLKHIFITRYERSNSRS
jgi:Transcription factor Tfb2.